MPPGKRSQRKKGKTDDPAVQEREKKIENLLLSLDANIAEQKKTMQANFEIAKDKMRKDYRTLQQSLSISVRQMTIKDFVAQNMNVEKAVQEEISTNANTKVNTKDVLAKFMKKTTLKAKATPSESTTKKKIVALSSKRRSVIGKKVRGSAGLRNSQMASRRSSTTKKKTASMDDSYVDISDDEVFTPATKKSKVPFAAVTPKFDPRKPVLRSELRRARPGELAMSLSGSPLLLEERTSSSAIKINMGNKILHIPDVQSLKGKPKPKDVQEFVKLRNIIDQMLKK